jgi:hypothetical protein
MQCVYFRYGGGDGYMVYNASTIGTIFVQCQLFSFRCHLFSSSTMVIGHDLIHIYTPAV